jgi:hypothetical protein
MPAHEVEFLRKMVRKNSSLGAKYHFTNTEVYLISWYERAEEIAMAGGRLTIYKLENAEIARQACMLSVTNDALAGRFEVCRRTIDNWIATIPEFSKAVRQGREVADESVQVHS